MLPTDCLITDAFDFKARTLGNTKFCKMTEIPADWEAVDIGPESSATFEAVVRSAKTVLWNGPMGVFEVEKSARGTFGIAKALAEATAAGATTVVGGGDSASAIKKAGLASKVSHVSTGGGASLEYLEGKPLPGVLALTDK
jgi:phosphoglycerate kinase